MCCRRWIVLLIVLLPFLASGQIITSVIGNGTATNTGDGGPATAAGIYYPCGGAFDKQGNFYFGEGIGGFRVRKVSTSGIISTYTGTGFSGYSGDGGPATLAKLKNSQAVAVDTAGNLFIVESYDNVIRRVDAATGIITTVAGTGVSGYNGDNIAATAAQLSGPLDICFDHSGNLYIADYATNLRVRKVDAAGIITTVAGNGSMGYSGEGGPATAAAIKGPSGICVDDSDNLYIADWYSRVLKVNSAGIITTYAGNGIAGSSGDGGMATAAMIVPQKIAFDRNGNLYIAEYDYNKVRMVNPSGIITTVAGTGIAGFSGDGGLATAAKMNHPGGITIDSCNNLYICDTRTYYIRKVNFHPSCGIPDTGGTLQVNTNAPANEFSFYPNPAGDELAVADVITKATYRLYDMVGKEVLQGELMQGSNTIALRGLTPGMYVLLLIDEAGKRTVHKVTKE